MASGREDHSGLALFAAELQAAREKAGLSQDALAARINYSASSVAMIESRRRTPSPDFASRCDDALGAPGTFARLQQHGRTAPFPVWFRPYAEIEAAAAQLRLFEHSLVPGLLQTEDYARAVLSTRPDTTEDDLAELVVARMDRQLILSREKPPRLWVVLDEGVLYRQIGSAKIMHEQLLQLADMADRPTITIEAPSALAGIMLTFDTLRSEALPRTASRDLIMKRAESYGAD